MNGANGAIADYVLPTANASSTKLGQGDKMNATIRTVDGGWFQLTLTSTLVNKTAYVIIQLSDEGGKT